MDEKTKAEYLSLLQTRLNEKRFIHSLNVADAAVTLARRFGADEEKAYLAGLLHDITKNETDENQLQIMESGGIILSMTQRNNPKLWHAMSGMIYLRDTLGIKDEEILGAVRWHTTGKAGMTLLEKVVFIADYISDERDYPDVDVMRHLAEVSLDAAALYALKYSLKHLSLKEKPICEDSVAMYNELVIRKRKDRSE
ncbi:MAG: bis(5'-nucleosyl)-tetraphosphatase (symmetrical) YqeK [Clostridia bacterium]|nr:bis(5'-nucleosyl)-tetraphosphatase (symmetrical) YqeK [Clostridia bacterium]